REENPITDRGTGTLLIRGNDTFAGPGHNARIITDKAGKDWFLYHAILKTNPRVKSGANRHSLMLDPLHWDDEDWPDIRGYQPDTSVDSALIFYILYFFSRLDSWHSMKDFVEISKIGSCIIFHTNICLVHIIHCTIHAHINF